MISAFTTPEDMKFLEKVATQSPHKEDRGLASLALSSALSALGDDPELIAKRLGYLKKAIEEVQTDSVVSGKKVADIISDQVYVIQNLTKGRKAPNFQGQDIGGRKISLTETSGKVTAVLFWRDQNVLQESLIPFLKDTKKLLDEVGGEMIGVYTGDSSQLRTLVADREVTWKNIYDENKDVSNQYRISKMPTIFLLDKAGKIQSIGEPNALINLSIRALANSSE